MKTLIIGDLHNKVGWVEACINAVKPDLTVFLGDYFDSFDETLEGTTRTAQWLKESLDHPNRVHLLGNHDMPYRFPMNFNLSCPGFTRDKSSLINDILSTGTSWEKMRSFHWIDGWLLSHAGIHLNLLHPLKGFDLKELRKLEEEAFEKCLMDISTPFFGCGFSRGGSYPCGGITWQDFDVDFVPIEGVNQIVGHTPHPTAKVKLMGNDSEKVIHCSWDEYLSVHEKTPMKSVNLDIDTCRRYYAILEKGKVQVVDNCFATEQDFAQ